MNTQDRNWQYQFTLKNGKRVFFNTETKEWATEIDWSALIEPTTEETAEIVQYIYETGMDAFDEVF